ncbi:MAG: universal stress protein [Flavobacteriales bacterium]|nr:universal stress protein [Flavobacteriales bacterium]
MEIKFKNILVGFDNSMSAQIALKKSAETAHRFGSKLHVLYVLREEKGSVADIEALVREICGKYNVEFEFISKSGKVSTELSTLEREIGADLIVVGSHGNRGWQPFWIGSNAYRIVSASNCPVITIQETTKEYDLRDILLPIDDSDATRQKVPYAAVLAKAFNATVHILAVSKRKGPRVKMRLKAYLKQTQKFLTERGVKSSVASEFGVDVPKKILEYSKTVKAGLIMIMSDTESRGLIMGNYSQDIINNSSVPVMTMHSRDLAIAGSAGY